jgi:hypothetical protein
MKVRSERVLTSWGRYRVVKTIELGEDDAMFVAVELSACAPKDGFTRDFTSLVFATWPEDDAQKDDGR